MRRNGMSLKQSIYVYIYRITEHIYDSEHMQSLKVYFVLCFWAHTNCRECPGRYGRDEGGSGGFGFVSHLISIRI